MNASVYRRRALKAEAALSNAVTAINLVTEGFRTGIFERSPGKHEQFRTWNAQFGGVIEKVSEDLADNAAEVFTLG